VFLDIVLGDDILRLYMLEHFFLRVKTLLDMVLQLGYTLGDFFQEYIILVKTHIGNLLALAFRGALNLRFFNTRFLLNLHTTELVRRPSPI